MAPEVSVIVTPRERLSSLEQCLRSLAKATDAAYEFIVVDQGYRPEQLERAARIVAPRDLRVVHDGTYVTEGQARNIGLAAARAPVWALIVDAEMEVAPDAVVRLRRAAEETGAAIVVPLVLEGKGLVHTTGGDLVLPDSPTGVVEGKNTNQHQPRPRQHGFVRHEITIAETHVMLLDKVTLGPAPFEPNNVRVFHLDFALTCYDRNWRTVFEPEACVLFHRPPPLPWSDYAFFSMRWNEESAAEGVRFFKAKWGFDPETEKTRAWEEFAFNMSIFPERLRNAFTQPFSNALWRARKEAGAFRRRMRFGGQGLVTLT